MLIKNVIVKVHLALALILPISSRQTHFNINGKENNTDEYRRNIIRDEFLWVYMNYKNRGFGDDELRPVSGKTDSVTWGGWGVTLIDCLDTLWIMGLYEEFQDAVQYIATLDFTRGHHVTSFFEVTIRYLGGLLSAYDLSGEKVLLEKARDLGDLLLNNFDSPSGLPYTLFDFVAKVSIKDNYVGLANAGSFQLEFAHLSKLTNDTKYFDIAMKVYRTIENNKRGNGIYNSDMDIRYGNFSSNAISFGGGADSFYEYLLKMYILLGSNHSHDFFLKTFSETMDTLRSLLRISYDKRLALGSLNERGQFEEYFHHLAFFVPGMLLLGDPYLPHHNLALIAFDLIETFYHVIELSPTGLAPESLAFSSHQDLKIIDPQNILRPELLESLYYAYKSTGRSIYQDRVWSMFKSFRTYSLSNYGYAEYQDVAQYLHPPQYHTDVMQSFFLAETFKYMYLTFDVDQFDLTKWVFTTEAHPLRVHH